MVTMNFYDLLQRRSISCVAQTVTTFVYALMRLTKVAEPRHIILATVLGAIPNRRAAARSLNTSIRTAYLTFA